MKNYKRLSHQNSQFMQDLNHVIKTYTDYENWVRMRISVSLAARDYFTAVRDISFMETNASKALCNIEGILRRQLENPILTVCYQTYCEPIQCMYSRLLAKIIKTINDDEDRPCIVKDTFGSVTFTFPSLDGRVYTYCVCTDLEVARKVEEVAPNSSKPLSDGIKRGESQI